MDFLNGEFDEEATDEQAELLGEIFDLLAFTMGDDDDLTADDRRLGLISHREFFESLRRTREQYRVTYGR